MDAPYDILLGKQLIIITYIYHVLSNALHAHIMHIKLNTIFCTHIEDSPTKTVYIRHDMETHTCMHTRMHAHTHCNRNWVLILAGAEIL